MIRRGITTYLYVERERHVDGAVKGELGQSVISEQFL